MAALAETGHLPAGLLPALLPGPVTLLLARRGDAPLCAELNPGVATVGACTTVYEIFIFVCPHA